MIREVTDAIQSASRSTLAVLPSTPSLNNRHDTDRNEDKQELLTPRPVPWLGKEYWFAYHTSPTSPDPHHLVLTGGRASSPLSIDGRTPNWNTSRVTRDPSNEPLPATVWGYHDQTTHRLFTDYLSLTETGDGLVGTNDEITVALTGETHPTSLTVTQDGTPEIKLQYTNPGSPGYGMEQDARLLGPIGYSLVNHHLEYTGQWNAEQVTGRAYVQKVRVVGPLIPWNWCKLYFADGSTFTGFWPWPTDSLPTGTRFAATPAFFDATTEETHRIPDVALNRDGDMYTLATPDDSFSVTMRIQTERTMDLARRNTSLSYTEYPVTITDATIHRDGITRTASDLGGGSGLVEHTTGVGV